MPNSEDEFNSEYESGNDNNESEKTSKIPYKKSSKKSE